ncbi:transcription factor 7-like 1-C [Entelurus aequoreus]|uniref:transcription factor 7-like 1-C n=1 Tax=Entelurus aequoreus TaxID=161455 RepID=UPI002B1D7EE6|nr:transcription factor 7-like 1-C [Entelurus aequoreus]
MQPSYLDMNPLGDVTKQYMNHQYPVSEWPVHYLHAPTPPQCLEGPPKMLPERATHKDIPASIKVSTSKKRKRDLLEGGEKAYIKKPPNAFMILRKEQMSTVKAQLNISNNAEANKVLGHMWRSLSASQQEQYYQLADVENKIHQELYPNWSYTDNYGKRKRKQRATVSTRINQCVCHCVTE